MVDVKKAEEVYSKIKHTLKSQEGKFIVIEPESGDYFVGDTDLEAYKAAKQKYPHKETYMMRIGFKAAYFIGAYEKISAGNYSLT